MIGRGMAWAAQSLFWMHTRHATEQQAGGDKIWMEMALTCRSRSNSTDDVTENKNWTKTKRK
jgi:hypothetical protein